MLYSLIYKALHLMFFIVGEDTKLLFADDGTDGDCWFTTGTTLVPGCGENRVDFVDLPAAAPAAAFSVAVAIGVVAKPGSVYAAVESDWGCWQA
ncbi:hypothetical protein OGATHE_003105 [Ogataea polymorpha]|uniref:Uncharacterized protein n=1 Tax=Ogataea polymorpha TaxID=460523 RepID=A0A9P8P952_9ASCO|nr:hypothetical protein OGATHE_003105 [Ogataea polymorpha]